jgi:hypothetical protein
VRPPSIKSAYYVPGQVPNDPALLPGFFSSELVRIAAVITLLAQGHIDKTYVEPNKPRDGDLAYADGAEWDPGSGKGLYLHNGSVWTLIKAIP